MASEKKNLSSPDDSRTFEKGKMEMVTVGDQTIGRYTFEPGWKWSEHVGPSVGADVCQSSHFLHQISGRMHIAMSDGSEYDVEPGDVCAVAPGHDAWVVGEETVVGIDVSGLADYASPS